MKIYLKERELLFDYGCICDPFYTTTSRGLNNIRAIKIVRTNTSDLLNDYIITY
jgi:hypothetical protein